MPLALSRTCNLADFADCVSVAEWQQELAECAYTMWLREQHVRTRSASLVVNYSDVAFSAPGPEAIYVYRGQKDDGLITHALPAVYGLRVIDQIEAPVRFLTRSAQVLRPKGLLVLTFTYWDVEGPDEAAGADSRRRIYNVPTMTKFISEARKAGFQPFGGVDWTYHGNTLDDHSLASLVLTRR